MVQMVEISKNKIPYKLYQILEMLDKGELREGTIIKCNKEGYRNLRVVKSDSSKYIILWDNFPATYVRLSPHLQEALWTIEPPEDTFILVSRTLQSSQKDGVDDYLDMALTKLEDKEHYTLTSFYITDTPTSAQTFTRKEIDDIPDSFGLSYNYDRIPLPINLKYTLD